MARVLCTFFIRQNKNRDWKPGDGAKTLEHHTDRPEPARGQARPADHREDGADPQRDARRFRPTRSPGPPDTSATFRALPENRILTWIYKTDRFL